MKYIIYTDGACSVNKRLGGYAAIAKFDGQQIVVHGNKKNATNNEMELLAVVSILRIINAKLKEFDEIEVNSDSAYIVNAINQNWLNSWSSNRWMARDHKPIKNFKLWNQILLYIESYENNDIKYSFIKVKGHGNCKLNNYVDRLAVKEVELLKQLED